MWYGGCGANCTTLLSNVWHVVLPSSWLALPTRRLLLAHVRYWNLMWRLHLQWWRIDVRMRSKEVIWCERELINQMKVRQILCTYPQLSLSLYYSKLYFPTNLLYFEITVWVFLGGARVFIACFFTVKTLHVSHPCFHWSNGCPTMFRVETLCSAAKQLACFANAQAASWTLLKKNKNRVCIACSVATDVMHTICAQSMWDRDEPGLSQYCDQLIYVR